MYIFLICENTWYANLHALVQMRKVDKETRNRERERWTEFFLWKKQETEMPFPDIPIHAWQFVPQISEVQPSWKYKHTGHVFCSFLFPFILFFSKSRGFQENMWKTISCCQRNEEPQRLRNRTGWNTGKLDFVVLRTKTKRAEWLTGRESPLRLLIWFLLCDISDSVFNLFYLKVFLLDWYVRIRSVCVCVLVRAGIVWLCALKCV